MIARTSQILYFGPWIKSELRIDNYEPSATYHLRDIDVANRRYIPWPGKASFSVLLVTAYHMKYSDPDYGILKTFHILKGI